MQTQIDRKAVVDQNRPLSPLWLRWLVIFLLVGGVVFRFVNLNHKVYWHDEVYTSLRASGYTVQDIGQEMFQNQVFAAKDLLRFQQVKPGSTPVDTIRSLALEDPQHPPLYFLLDRLWHQVLGAPIQAFFGSPLTASRLLPALLSLLSLPFMYALAWELFASQAAALLATAFLALSPFDVLFAQTARQYSLLTLAVIASHYLLLRAVRLSHSHTLRSRDVLKRPPAIWQHWGLYVLAVTLGLYTHPFFALTLIGHAGYMLLLRHPYGQTSQSMTRFWLSLAIAGVLYTPWLFVLLTGLQRALSTTDWTASAAGSHYLLKLWTLSFTALFLDLDVGFNNIWTFVLRVPLLVLFVLAFYTLYKRCDRSVWLFVWTSTIVPFLVLALPDLMLGSRRSAVSRYLIACYPGVQLAIAFFLATRLTPKPHYLSSRPTNLGSTKRAALLTLRPTPYTLTFINRWFWRTVLLALFTASLASCTVSAASDTWWHNVPSYFNAAIARRVNAASSPLLLSDVGNDFTNLGDLISLSYRLNPNVQMLLLSRDVHWVTTQSFASQTDGATVFVFRPSKPLREALERSRGALQPTLTAAQLWQISQP